MRKPLYTIRVGGRTKSIRHLYMRFRGKWWSFRFKGRRREIRYRGRWAKIVKLRRYWYIRYRRRWIKIRRFSLKVRIHRRTYGLIRPRGRRLYLRYRGRTKRVKRKFVRYIRCRGRRLRVKRKGMRVILRLGKRKWTRRLRVKRYREWIFTLQY